MAGSVARVAEPINMFALAAGGWEKDTLAKEIPESVLAYTVEGQVPDGPSLQDLSQEETGHSRKGILKTVL